MKQFKKKTIALVLASVVTVVGAFGAENYKNSLMSLKFDRTARDTASVTVLTKKDYTENINPIKRDANTYIIMLPDTNNEITEKIQLGAGIQSYNVTTMPYTSSSNGYTKITIKTTPNLSLKAAKALYVPQKTETPEAIETEVPPTETPAAPNPQTLSEIPPKPADTKILREEQPGRIRSQSGVAQTGGVDINESVRQFEPDARRRPVTAPIRNKRPTAVRNTDKNTASNDISAENLPVQETSGGDFLLFILGFLLVSCIIVYLIIRAGNKMKELLGDQPTLDLDDEDIKPKKKKQKTNKAKSQVNITKIQKTVKTLDRMYAKPEKIPVNNIIEPPQAPPPVEEEPNIVDLDELFQEKNKAASQVSAEEENDEENLALEDFLSAYSFDDEEPEKAEEKEAGFDEKLYEKYINDGDLKFSEDDVNKINQLLNSEINDETLRNIQNYAPSEPKPEVKRSQEEVLADLVTTYAINQNISFTKEDVEALNKLISVELDEEFITDLKTDPGRLREKAQEYTSESEKTHKTSELLTLNVKDMLPDLSEALKKQGGRRIESEVKPTVVYYSEGYDVSILSLKDKLPDLSLELHNKDAYKSRPSDEIQYVESGYDVAKMHISNELPDLRDALKNPEKYENKPEKPVVADEASLLERITNVSFKPFYDGSESFEVVNEYDNSNAPSVSDMQKEFNQFGDIEIVRDDDFDVPTSDEKEYDDFVSLYDNKYLDFDKPSFLNDDKKQEEPKQDIASPTNTEPLSKEETNSRPRRDNDTEKLIKSIQEKQSQKAKEESLEPARTVAETPSPVIEKSCLIDGIKYDVVDECNFKDNIGCYLAKNSSGYTVIGYVGDRTFELKQYSSLGSERIKARVSENFDDGSTRYIVRADSHKFIVNVSNDNLEFVMDLC